MAKRNKPEQQKFPFVEFEEVIGVPAEAEPYLSPAERELLKAKEANRAQLPYTEIDSGD